MERPEFATKVVAVPGILVEQTRFQFSRPSASDWFSNEAVLDVFIDGDRGRNETSRGSYPDTDLPARDRPIGRMMFIPSGRRVRVESQKGWSSTLRFCFGRISQQLPQSISVAHLLSMLDIGGSELAAGCEKIMREVQRSPTPDLHLISLWSQIVEVELVRLVERWLSSRNGHIGGLSPWRLKRIRQRVLDGGPLPSIAELGQLVGLSERHLMRTFKEETGQTLRHYMATQRVELAKALLRGESSVKQVAYDLCFSDISSFSTAFKRHSGMSPKEFRAISRSC